MDRTTAEKVIAEINETTQVLIDLVNILPSNEKLYILSSIKLAYENGIALLQKAIEVAKREPASDNCYSLLPPHVRGFVEQDFTFRGDLKLLGFVPGNTTINTSYEDFPSGPILFKIAPHTKGEWEAAVLNNCVSLGQRSMGSTRVNSVALNVMKFKVTEIHTSNDLDLPRDDKYTAKIEFSTIDDMGTTAMYSLKYYRLRN